MTETGERAASPPRNRESSPSPTDAQNKPRSTTAERGRDTREGATRRKAGCKRLPVPERGREPERGHRYPKRGLRRPVRETKIPSEGGALAPRDGSSKHPVMGTPTPCERSQPTMGAQTPLRRHTRPLRGHAHAGGSTDPPVEEAQTPRRGTDMTGHKHPIKGT